MLRIAYYAYLDASLRRASQFLMVLTITFPALCALQEHSVNLCDVLRLLSADMQPSDLPRDTSICNHRCLIAANHWLARLDYCRWLGRRNASRVPPLARG